MRFFLRYTHNDILLSLHFVAPTILDHEDLKKKFRTQNMQIEWKNFAVLINRLLRDHRPILNSIASCFCQEFKGGVSLT